MNLLKVWFPPEVKTKFSLIAVMSSQREMSSHFDYRHHPHPSVSSPEVKFTHGIRTRAATASLRSSWVEK